MARIVAFLPSLLAALVIVATPGAALADNADLVQARWGYNSNGFAGSARDDSQQEPTIVVLVCVVPAASVDPRGARYGVAEAVEIAGRESAAVAGMSCGAAIATLLLEGLELESAFATTSEHETIQYNLFRDRAGYGLRRYP